MERLSGLPARERSRESQIAHPIHVLQSDRAVGVELHHAVAVIALVGSYVRPRKSRLSFQEEQRRRQIIIRIRLHSVIRVTSMPDAAADKRRQWKAVARCQIVVEER